MATTASIVLEYAPWPRLLALLACVLLAWELLRVGRRLREHMSRPKAALLAVLLVPLGLPVAGTILLGAAPAARWLAPLGAWAGVLGLGALATYFLDPFGAVATLLILTAGWSLRAYGRTTTHVAPRAKTVLVALRLTAMLMLAVLLLSPMWQRRWTESIPATVLVAVDTSASMARHDVTGPAGPQSRRDALEQALRWNREALDDLAQHADVKWMIFAAAPQSLPDGTGGQPPALPAAEGQATAIGDSLASVAPLAGNSHRLQAVLLLSDGCNNTSDLGPPQRIARQLGDGGASLYTVGVGPSAGEATANSLTVSALACPDEVDAFTSMTIEAEVRCVNLPGRQLRVVCHMGDELVGEQTLATRISDQRTPVRFSFVPTLAGFHHVRMEVSLEGPPPDLAGEPRSSRLVHVVDRQLRALLIEGGFRSEGKFLTQALSAGRQFAVERLVLPGPAHHTPPPNFGQKLEDWLPYHVIILCDLPPTHLTPEQSQTLRRLVSEYGKGLAFVGVRGAFDGDAWRRSDNLTALLPVELPAGPQDQPDAQIRLVPTPEGMQSEILQLGDGTSEPAGKELWEGLPPLPSSAKLGEPRPAARVLATDEADRPLMVAAPYGKGRVLAIGLDQTWRWALSPRDTQQHHRRFWRQVAMHLADPTGNLWITADKRSYDLRRLTSGAETVHVSAGMEDAQGRPVDLAHTVTLTMPTGNTMRVQMRRDGALLRSVLGPLTQAGLYTLQLDAPTLGVNPAIAKFDVIQRDLESMDVLPNHDLLRELARLGRGRYATLDDLGSVLEDITRRAEPTTLEHISRQDLLAHLRWPMVVIIISLLCAEWAMRKRLGLV